MEVPTQAGIQIDIQTNGSSKIMRFDKPVKLIELTYEESAHIGTLLSIDSKTGITTELRKLIIEKYFSAPRSFREIKDQLHSKCVNVKSTSLNTILGKMIERQELTRSGTSGAYLYQQKD